MDSKDKIIDQTKNAASIMRGSLYKNANKIMSDWDVKDVLKTTSLLGLFMSIAWIDEKLHTGEIIYTKENLKKLVSLNKDELKKIMQMAIYVTKNDSKAIDYLPHYIEYLNHELTAQEKEKTILILLAIARVDLKMTMLEIKAIKIISKQFGMPHGMFTNAIEATEESLKKQLNAIRDEINSLYNESDESEIEAISEDSKRSWETQASEKPETNHKERLSKLKDPNFLLKV